MSLNSVDALLIYKRACSYASLSKNEDALKELTIAIEFNEIIKDIARVDKNFAALVDNPDFIKLVS